MNDRDCSRIFAMLSAYLDRELPSATCDELEIHLRDCPECIEFVNSLRRSVELCRQYGASRAPESIEKTEFESLRGAYERMLRRRDLGK